MAQMMVRDTAVTTSPPANGNRCASNTPTAVPATKNKMNKRRGKSEDAALGIADHILCYQENGYHAQNNEDDKHHPVARLAHITPAVFTDLRIGGYLFGAMRAFDGIF